MCRRSHSDNTTDVVNASFSSEEIGPNNNPRGCALFGRAELLPSWCKRFVLPRPRSPEGKITHDRFELTEMGDGLYQHQSSVHGTVKPFAPSVRGPLSNNERMRRRQVLGHRSPE